MIAWCLVVDLHGPHRWNNDGNYQLLLLLLLHRDNDVTMEHLLTNHRVPLDCRSAEHLQKIELAVEAADLHFKGVLMSLFKRRTLG